MNGYWLGVLTGIGTALIAFLVLQFINITQQDNVVAELRKCQEQVKELSAIVEEDRQIMRTYKFFNESWQAIIDMEKRENGSGR